MTDPSAADRDRWERRWTEALVERAAAARAHAPSAWVVARALELPADALVVELACGDGRHARALAAAGRRVLAVDFVERAVRAAAATRGVHGVVADAGRLPFAPGTLDAIVLVNFLDRALFPTLAALLRPGGALVYETYTRAQLALAAAGRAPAPRSARYLLEPGELPALVSPLAVTARREGLVVDDAGERCVSSVVAVRR
jgi:SAM-dependent methyltransferase